MVNLQDEGERCKTSLKEFTANIVTRLDISHSEAEGLHKYDRSRRDGNIYLHFPFCFLEAFPGLTVEPVRNIALSAILWMSYMRAQDDAVDKNGDVEPNSLFLRDLYLRQSLHLLYMIFPPDSTFWNSYSSYFDEYARAVLCEKRSHSGRDAWDENEFNVIAKGKAAMAKYPIAGLAALSGHNENVSLLTESLDSFHVGYQYWDDVVDWKADLASLRYSLLLRKAFERLTPEQQKQSPIRLRESLAYMIYYSGLAEDDLKRSYNWLQRAFDLSLEAGCTVWADYVKRLQKQTVVLARDLRSIAQDCAS